MNNTLNTLINSVIQNINENTIDDLIGLGFDHGSAVKMVTEFDGYNFIEEAEENPVDF